MVSLSTKRRGVAVVAVLTLGLLFGIALLMMHDALPIAETNFSTEMGVSMTLYTRSSSSSSGDFYFVNTADGKVLAKYAVPKPGSNCGNSKTANVDLNEELGQLFCLCATGYYQWYGELSDFNVKDVSVLDVSIILRLSSYGTGGSYPCRRFGIESEKLVDKGGAQGCSVSNIVSMSIRTLSDPNSDTVDDFEFVNTAKAKVVARYRLSQPARLIGETKKVSVAMNEELGQLFCLCSTGEDGWSGELNGFKIDDVSFPGVVTSLKLSKNDAGYSPCWRFGIESEELVDKGYSQECAVTTTEISLTIYTKEVAYSDTSDDFTFVNMVNGEAIGQYKISQPGPIEGGSKTVSLTLNEDLGEFFCLCSTDGDSWEGELTDFQIGGVAFTVLANSLKLSTDDAGYYPCWRFGIESEVLMDKGHSESCS